MIAIAKANTHKKLQSTVEFRNSRFMKALRTHLLALQFAKMVRVFNDLPEWALEEIGITKSEIPEYARKLIYET